MDTVLALGGGLGGTRNPVRPQAQGRGSGRTQDPTFSPPPSLCNVAFDKPLLLSRPQSPHLEKKRAGPVDPLGALPALRFKDKKDEGL